MSIILAFAGSKRVGKDYAYQYAKQLYPNRKVTKLAFADPIKKVICDLFGLKDEAEYDLFKTRDVYTNLEPWLRLQIPGRKIVRDIGMLLRAEDPERFTTYVWSKLRDGDEDEVFIITDLRFENELTMLQEMSNHHQLVVVIKVERPGCDYDGHPTERDWLSPRDVDAIIENNGTLEDYQRNLEVVFQNYIGDIE